MYKPLCIIFISSFLFAANCCSAQETKTNDSLSLIRYADSIEANTQYRFFFNPQEIESLYIKGDRNGSVEQVLQSALKNSSFSFSIDANYRVFITRTKVQTNLPSGFFAFSDTSGTPIPAAVKEVQAPASSSLVNSVENKLFIIGSRSITSKSGNATIAGYVRDVRTGEGLAGASVFLDTPSIGVTTDGYGYYSISLPRGRHVLRVSSAGMSDTRRQIQIFSNGTLDIELHEYVAPLAAVVVSTEKVSNTRSTQMGVNRLNIRTIRQVPVVFGEADVLKVVLALPGVTSAGEAGNGYNVRGGSTDQNLIRFNDATIYNPNHLFGFFSAFDPDVVKGIELYKSAIPEKFGGRLSSVLDVSLQEGNKKKWTGIAGIGPLTSKLTVEGPLNKKGSSVILGGRTSYSDWLLRTVPRDEYKNSSAGFYDAVLNITHNINRKNTLYLMGYISQDRFNLNNDTNYNYANRSGNIKWKHIFNNNFYSITTAGIDHYQYKVSSSQNPVDAFKLQFSINQAYLRSDFTYSPSNRQTISFGYDGTFYKLNPGSFNPSGTASLVTPKTVEAEQALEQALYLGDQFKLTPKLLVSGGLRYSYFVNLGPSKVNEYAPGLPRDTTTIISVKSYTAGQQVISYGNPELRFSLRYAFSDSSSVKASFNTLAQYIHLLTNTTTVSPTDIWKLSDPNIKPQQGSQVSLGYYHNFNNNTIEASIEVYYKESRHVLDYKSGASLLLNKHIETDVINTSGKAYGAELLIRKTAGKLNGWLSYTFSRTFLQQQDELSTQKINHGNWYPASFDKPHNVNFIGNYRFSHRYSLSMNVLYSTGRPITLPIAVFQLGGATALLYSDRNKYRIPDYFRTDLSFTIEGNHKTKQRLHNSWSFGFYNLTGRQNAYSVYFVQEGGKVKGYQLSIFGTVIPFVTYNVKF